MSNPTLVLSCWWRGLICTRQRFWQRKLMFTFPPSPFQNCSLFPHFCLFVIRKLGGGGGRNLPKYNLKLFKSKKRHMVLYNPLKRNVSRLLLRSWMCTLPHLSYFFIPYYFQPPPQTRPSTSSGVADVTSSLINSCQFAQE